ncbi:MAG: hypothetical protein JNJ54_03285 [Myxococcaceae bacterium]|nr:hypothetical protein [Myxococcaceae bacterium]
MRVAALLVLSSVVAGCSPRPPPLSLPGGCQPLLAGLDCLLPYPSDAFRVSDPAQPSGARIALSDAALPRSNEGKRHDVTLDRPLDGFSTVPTIVATLGVALSAEGFVALEHGGAPSLSKDTSNTLLLDAETRSPVPHFVDLDPRATDGARQALVLHPFVALEPQRRYLVLLAGARTVSGELAKAPEGFRRLVDGQAVGDPAFGELTRAFEERIVPAAKAVGLERRQLQLAWEFTTGSREWATRDLLDVRRLTLAWLEGNRADVRVTSVNERGPADTFRIVKGSLTGPAFCSMKAQPGCVLVRGDDGRIVQQGVVEFPFVAVIPKSVEQASSAAPPILYGHGFFGTLAEVEDTSARGVASAAGRVMIAAEWWGMHFTDLAVLGDGLTGRLSQTTRFTERVHQGMANWLVLTSAAERFGELPAFQRPRGEALVAGAADAFLGISQGHILGGTLAAVNPPTTKIALNVGGAGFTTMMIRAEAFSGLIELLALSVSDPLEQQKFLAQLQRPLDRIDPATYAPFLLREPLPGQAPRRVLMQIGLMDAAVPNLGSFLHARLIGLPVLTPSPRIPWGLETATYPATSGLQLHDFQLGDPDAFSRRADAPAMATLVHEAVRTRPAVLRQLEVFFRSGEIVQTCDGPCDPE